MYGKNVVGIYAIDLIRASLYLRYSRRKNLVEIIHLYRIRFRGRVGGEERRPMEVTANVIIEETRRCRYFNNLISDKVFPAPSRTN